jgi:hypothetical protein
MKATIRLFRAVPIDSSGKKEANEKLLQETIKRGFVFAPEVVYNYPEQELFDMIKTIEEEVGLTAEQMNTTFQKSWKKVQDKSMHQLFLEQLLHYFTTYGFDELGIYDEGSVYVPQDKLALPALSENIKLVVIRGYTKEELKEKLMTLLRSGLALAEETMEDITTVGVFVDISEEDIDQIKNAEIKAILYDYFEIVPKNPIEFLRFLLYKTIDSTLLIKNEETFLMIQENARRNIKIAKLTRKYRQEYGLEPLASIFYRFKPLFLAFRKNENLRPIINRIRKLAIKHHKPMKEDYLNSITAKIKHGEKIDHQKLRKELSKVNIFRKLRLAQALRFRTLEDMEAILYRIRNGSAYATEFEFTQQAKAEEILEIVVQSIIETIRPKVQGKTIYIPKYMHYSLPTTEKQFTGNFPNGSSVIVDKEMIFGIHWTDTQRRIDLDLSLLNAEIGKIGWNTAHKNREKTILFSGDLTNAPKPNGATELFYIKKQQEESYALFVNYYNFNSGDEVPIKILVAQEKPENFEQGYMVDPNNVICKANSKIAVKQKILGLLTTTKEGSKFYFCETELGRTNVSGVSLSAERAREFLYHYYRNMMSLNAVLTQAGAKILTEKTEEYEQEQDSIIDLSPEKMEKDTLLKLIL